MKWDKELFGEAERELQMIRDHTEDGSREAVMAVIAEQREYFPALRQLTPYALNCLVEALAPPRVAYAAPTVK